VRDRQDEAENESDEYRGTGAARCAAEGRAVRGAGPWCGGVALGRGVPARRGGRGLRSTRRRPRRQEVRHARLIFRRRLRSQHVRLPGPWRRLGLRERRPVASSRCGRRLGLDLGCCGACSGGGRPVPPRVRHGRRRGHGSRRLCCDLRRGLDGLRDRSRCVGGGRRGAGDRVRHLRRRARNARGRCARRLHGARHRRGHRGGRGRRGGARRGGNGQRVGASASLVGPERADDRCDQQGAKSPRGECSRRIHSTAQMRPRRAVLQAAPKNTL
jgi:hypothetical protein